jgi:hypothetical protein
MPRRKPKPQDLTTEQLAKKLFPKPVRDAVAKEAAKAKKMPKTKTTKKDST